MDKEESIKGERFKKKKNSCRFFVVDSVEEGCEAAKCFDVPSRSVASLELNVSVCEDCDFFRVGSCGSGVFVFVSVVCSPRLAASNAGMCLDGLWERERVC